MRPSFDSTPLGGAPLRRLLLGIAAVTALPACAQVLGLDPLSESRDPDGGSTVDAGGAADAVASDAAPMYAPLACDWKPGSLRLVNSLAGNAPPEHQYHGNIVMAPAEPGARVFLEHSTPNGNFIQLWTVDSDFSELTNTISAAHVLSARRIGANRVGALVSIPNADGSQGIQLAVATVIDHAGTEPIQLDVLSQHPTFNVNAAFLPVNGGAANQALVAVTSYRPAPELPYRAELVYWDSDSTMPAQPVVFNEDQTDSLGGADYEITAMLRDGIDRTHVFLGSRFEGAMGTRHFILGDDVSGRIEPVRFIDDLIVGFQPRGDGSYFAAYAELDSVSGSLALRLGAIAGSELATHTIDDLPATAPLGTFADLPVEGEPFLTRDHFILLGKRERDAREELAVMLVHRSGQLRANHSVPFPAAAPLPEDGRFKRIAALVRDPLLFDDLGGDISVVWTVEVTNEDDELYDELFHGELQCLPSSSTTAAP